jgi:bifunctional non-homologous end joining protein LigD
VKAGRHDLLGRTIEVSSVDRVMVGGLTKGDLVDYYARIAPTMFRYLEDRPIAIRRYPEGAAGEGFFQKQIAPHFPDWVGHVEAPKRGGVTDTIVVSEPAVIAYLANLNAIEIHGWLATADALDHPDQIVFDLDPPAGDIDGARRATRRVREVLDELGLPSLVKTSGSAGYHVHVLLDGSDHVDVTRAFAADVAEVLAARYPDEVTGAHRKAQRHGRVLIDHFRNNYAQTVAAPYSVRARDGAPVSTPIDWDELGRVDPRTYTVTNIFRRLGQRDDPWAVPWGSVTDLGGARAELDDLLAELGT